MNILVLDVGGTNVKVWLPGESEKLKFPSGKELTPKRMVEQFKEFAPHAKFDRVSIGYPGEVANGRPVADPFNLGPGWVGFDYSLAFECPLRLMNDACMQALGSYEGGRMLYLGLGTGIGTTFIIDGKIVPLALGHLKLMQGESFDHYLSRAGLELLGVKRWNRAVAKAAETLRYAFLADYVVLGGGNAKKVTVLPEKCRLGSNQNAYFGGIRLWDDAPRVENSVPFSVVPDPALRVVSQIQEPRQGA